MKKIPPVSLWHIVSHFFYVSTFTLGGGYSMLLVFEDFYVNKQKVFSKEDWEELVLVAQAAPGAFAINLAYLVGYDTYGLLGSTLAVLAVTLPAFLSIVVVSAIIMNYMHTDFMRSFLVGVTCGPIAYFTFTFIQLAKKAFRSLWILLSFIFFLFMQLIFGLPIWILLVLSLGLIVLNIVFFIYRNKRKALITGAKKGER